MSLTDKGKQQILRQQMHASFPFLIKINWGNGVVSRYINADEDMDYEEYDVENDTTSTETYEAYTFSVILPESSERGYGTGTLRFSKINDNTNIIGVIRELTKRATIEITGLIVYQDGQIDGVESIFDTMFYLSNPSWGDDSDVIFNLKIDDGLELQMPCDVLNETTCAGVV